jgi:cation diffusion facilitator family transporter
MRVGRKHGSITLEADAHHLLTDVWTSVGVVVAVALVALTGWERLDPVIAVVVAANIVWTGAHILRRSVAGLMDTALPVEERCRIEQVLARFSAEGIQFHELRTRQAASRRFVSVHVLVPGSWTVQRGHDLVERVENEIRAALPGSDVSTHLEAVEDPASWEDATSGPHHDIYSG